MQNPLSENSSDYLIDETLIYKAVSGDKKALEEFVKRHQDWIYNIALRMLYYPDDAKDVTQEVLIKIITKLSTFKGNSNVKTWIYRIVVNYILNLKKSKSEINHITNFEDYGNAIDNCPDFELKEDTFTGFNSEDVVEEVKLGCLYGMLLCLDREQRMVFILGSLFGVSDKTGAELLEISRDSFRQKLSRARKDIFNFMNNKCGLVNKSNPCRCRKKTVSLISQKVVNPENLLFNKNYSERLKDRVPVLLDDYETFIQKKGAELFGNQPFRKSPDFVIYIQNLIKTDSFKEIFNLN